MNGITINDKQYIYVPVPNTWGNCCKCCFYPKEQNTRCKHVGFCVNFSRLVGMGVFKELKEEK